MLRVVANARCCTGHVNSFELPNRLAMQTERISRRVEIVAQLERLLCFERGHRPVMVAQRDARTARADGHMFPLLDRDYKIFN